MKNTFKLLGNIIIVILIVLVGCNELPNTDGYVKTHSGKINADTDGKVTFIFENQIFTYNISCIFTTDLPSPNDVFTLSSAHTLSNGNKTIEGLTAGQSVNWTAKCDYYILKDEQETGTVKIVTPALE